MHTHTISFHKWDGRVAITLRLIFFPTKENILEIFLCQYIQIDLVLFDYMDFLKD